jgi:hypothetical protein
MNKSYTVEKDMVPGIAQLSSISFPKDVAGFLGKKVNNVVKSFGLVLTSPVE